MLVIFLSWSWETPGKCGELPGKSDKLPGNLRIALNMHSERSSRGLQGTSWKFWEILEVSNRRGELSSEEGGGWHMGREGI